MNVRNFAMALGVVFIGVGILGFIPGANQMHHGGDPNLTVTDPGHGHLMGLFHVNVLHNAVHLLFGVMGVVMARSWDSARLYARIVAVAYLLLAIMGLMPGPFRYTFGLVPIEGNDVWLHFLIGAVALYFGFLAPHVNPDAATTAEVNSAGTTR